MPLTIGLTGGIAAGKSEALAAFSRLGAATLSSDAHAPQDVARDFATAGAALRGAGYETITRFSGREPRQVALRWA